MAISTYGELTNLILSWLDRVDATTSARVPDFITLAEAEMKRELRQSVARAALSLTTAEATLPATVRDLQMIRLNTGVQSYDLPLDPRTQDELITLRSRLSPTGRPRFYAQVGTSLLLAPAPDGTYASEITYVEAFTPLSASDSGTWTLLAAAPDMYLYGALAHAAGYLEHDATNWRALFDKAIAKVNEEREKHEAELQNQPARLYRVFG